MASPRSKPSGPGDAKSRLRTAEAYLEVADLVLQEQSGAAFLNVGAGLAVLAGIAAADAICAVRLGQVHRGDDHRGAADLLVRATPDGPALATTFRRLIDVKDEAHYGVGVVAATKARNTLRWAERLVLRARQEVER